MLQVIIAVVYIILGVITTFVVSIFDGEESVVCGLLWPAVWFAVAAAAIGGLVLAPFHLAEDYGDDVRRFFKELRKKWDANKK